MKKVFEWNIWWWKKGVCTPKGTYMYVLVKAGGKRDRERDREAGETKFRQWVQPKLNGGLSYALGALQMGSTSAGFNICCWLRQRNLSWGR